MAARTLISILFSLFVVTCGSAPIAWCQTADTSALAGASAGSDVAAVPGVEITSTNEAICGCDPQDRSDLQELRQIAGHADFVLLGEVAHRTVLDHCLANRMFRDLSETQHFRVILFESPWGVDDALKDFMNSNRTTLTANERYFLGVFYSNTTLNLLEYIRNHNREYPNDRIRLAGFLPEQPVTDSKALLKLLSMVPGPDSSIVEKQFAVCKAGDEKYKADLDFVQPATTNIRDLLSFTQTERQNCVEALGAADNFLDNHRAELRAKISETELEEAHLHIKSLRAYVEDELPQDHNASEKQSRDVGDRGLNRFDKDKFMIFQDLRKILYPNMKIMLWMHNWHASKHSPELTLAGYVPYGTVSIGTRLAEAYGSRLVSIGTVAIVPCRHCTKPAAGRLDVAFVSILGGKTVLLDTHHPIGIETQLPLKTKGILPSGPAGASDGQLQSLVLSRQFDGVYYAPSTTFLSRNEARQK